MIRDKKISKKMKKVDQGSSKEFICSSQNISCNKCRESRDVNLSDM